MPTIVPTDPTRQLRDCLLGLATGLALRNAEFDAARLDGVAWSLLEDVWFLAMAEARRLEPLGQLEALLRREHPGERLGALWRRVARRFRLCATGASPWSGGDVVLDGPSLRQAVATLLAAGEGAAWGPAERLGQWREARRELELRLTPSRRVELIEGEGVQGAAYAPTEVVETMVGWALGPALAQAQGDPEAIAALRVLDPACGAGSFLLGALRQLAAALEVAYLKKGRRQWKKLGHVVEAPSGGLRLSAARRAQLLEEGLAGVDTDVEALRAARRALVLEAYTGELDEAAGGGTQLAMFRPPAPDLEARLVWGDALRDAREGPPQVEPGGVDWARLGGREFSVVLASPPEALMAARGGSGGDGDQRNAWLRERYRVATSEVDLYQVFLERALEMVGQGGRVAMILPQRYLMSTHARALRRLLLEGSAVEILALPELGVFPGRSVDCAIVVLRRGSAAPDHRVSLRHAARPAEPFEETARLLQRLWASDPECRFDASGDLAARRVLEAVEAAGVPLGKVADALLGVQTHDRETWVQPQPPPTARSQGWRPAIDGGQIHRFALSEPTAWVCVEEQAIKSGGREEIHQHDRIGVRQIGRHPIAAMVPAGVVTLHTVYNVSFTEEDCPYDLHYVLALLSSSLLRWYWERRGWDQKRTFPRIKKEPLLALPIRPIDFDSEEDGARHDQVVALADEMIELRQELGDAEDAAAYDGLLERIRAVEARLDRVIFALYGLDEEQVALVEAGLD